VTAARNWSFALVCTQFDISDHDMSLDFDFSQIASLGIDPCPLATPECVCVCVT